jgi:hypothetical protein
MRTRTAVVTGVAVFLMFVRAGAQSPDLQELAAQLQQAKEELPRAVAALAAYSTAPQPPSATTALPEASIVEPFEIGEALFDQGRIEQAVVSMLALMHIGVVPDIGASPATTQNARLVLSTSEVRALIDMGREDLESSSDIENLPYSFGDLHAAVADLLPGVSVEQMADAYTRAYQAAPDHLIAKAQMGRPIEPETKLTRTQIWFLLMDGFAGAAAGDARWGTADRELPELRSPNAQWSAAEFREVVARLPLITASRLVTVSSPDVITQGASAKPAPVNVTMRASASATALVSRSSGRTLIAARAGSLSGQEVTWHVRDDSALTEIGTITSPLDDPIRVGADGVARFVVQPGIDATHGTGQIIDDFETVDASIDTRGAVAAAYAIPAPLQHLTFGASRARANVHLRWRSADVMWMRVRSRYANVNFEIPGLGGGTRTGVDTAVMELRKRSDGAYVGAAWAEVAMTQALRGPSPQARACANAGVKASQVLRVRATPVTECGSAADCASAAPMMNAPPTPSAPGAPPAAARASAANGFGPAHRLEDYFWSDAQYHFGKSMVAEPPDGTYYRLEFFPVTPPNSSAPSPCIPFIPAGEGRQGYGASDFIPFNDAQWTTSGQGYAVVRRSRGLTKYIDASSDSPLVFLGQGTNSAGDDQIRRGLTAARTIFKLTGGTHWYIAIAPTREGLE